MKKNNFNNVINEFGDEWEKFDNETLSVSELQNIFNNYFKIFPKKFLSKNKIGIDLGSGSGRWAYFVTKRVKKLYLLEPSKKAINISKKNGASGVSIFTADGLNDQQKSVLVNMKINREIK